MVMVCYDKPNRTKVRVFTAKDVKRIASYAEKDGAHPFEIIAGVGFSLGLGYIFCIAARTIDNSAKISKIILKIAGATALTKIVEFVLSVITSGAYRKLSGLRRIGAVFLILALVVEPIFKGILSLVNDAEIMVGSATMVHDICSRVKTMAAEAGEGIDAKYSDIADFLD